MVSVLVSFPLTVRRCVRSRVALQLEVVHTEKSVLVAAVDVAADDGYASGR